MNSSNTPPSITRLRSFEFDCVVDINMAAHLGSWLPSLQSVALLQAPT
jgi:hypothetical protein